MKLKYFENFVNYLNESTEDITDLSKEELKSMTFIDCQTAIFLLNQYLMHLKTLIAREKSVKAWAEQGLWYIVTGVQHDKYAKWEEKYHSAIRYHKSGLKLQMLKTTSDARILAGEAKIGSIETAMKVLENMGRNKSYERS